MEKQYLNSIFKGKMYIDENRVRTTDLNEVVKLVSSDNVNFRGDKKRKALIFQCLSGQVAGTGFEPMTFGL